MLVYNFFSHVEGKASKEWILTDHEAQFMPNIKNCILFSQAINLLRTK